MINLKSYLTSKYPQIKFTVSNGNRVPKFNPTIKSYLALKELGTESQEIMALLLERVYQIRKINNNAVATYVRTEHGLTKKNEQSSFRRCYKLNATKSLLPSERAQLLAMYKQSRLLTKMTGVQYVVDHIVPLVGKNEFGEHNVCGLHVLRNVQIITEFDNQLKGCLFIDKE
jgi:hypothetical protein